MAQRKKITLQDIADHANVSVSTVSRVITGSASVKEPKRKMVLDSAVALGYWTGNNTPQELLAEQQVVIGIVTQHISNPYFGNIVYGIYGRLRELGYSYVITDGNWNRKDEVQAIATLQNRMTNGLIILGGAQSDETYEELAQHTPIMIVGRHIDTLSRQCLTSNNEAGGYQATRYLIEMGHTRIAHITGPQSQPDAEARKRGYVQALQEAGIEVDPNLIVEGGFSEQSGLLAVEMLLAQTINFSAIFAANDLTAMGIRLALHRRGIRVPDDVSIIGYDNHPSAAYMSPPLTTIQQPDYVIGGAAAEGIVALIQNKPIEKPIFETRLVTRESVIRHL